MCQMITVTLSSKHAVLTEKLTNNNDILIYWIAGIKKKKSLAVDTAGITMHSTFQSLLIIDVA